MRESNLHPFLGTRRVLLAGLLPFLLAVAVPAGGQSPPGSFLNFESGHVRPLALSPDGSRLFAVNTVDDRLEIFDVTPEGLELAAEVAVGLEPVAVAARTSGEVWVVNHLSDSISIVTIDPVVELSRVTRTLLTCDEPRDIVFAGPGGNRAFVTTARRGQSCPIAFNAVTEGIGRAIVQVFDANALGAALGGTPIANVVLFGDTPRALAKSPDGSTVYAAVFHSGNQTTTLLQPVVSNNGGLPPPPSGALGGGPATGLILKFDGVAWVDEIGRDFTSLIPLSLPDMDVFPIDANAATPAAIAGAEVSGVGTLLFNMAANPSSGKVYVANTESHNDVRFEGIVFDGTRGVRARLVESSISVVDGASSVRHHLNPHIDYSVSPGDEHEIAESVAFPMDMAFSSDGGTVYVAMFGSARVVAYDTALLEAGSVDAAKSFISVGGGPSGLALDEANDRVYVMNRFDHRIGIVTNASEPDLRAQTSTVALGYDPQPPSVRKGRRHLYNAKKSGHGDQACASCHAFADMDDLAWDLGDAEATSTTPNCNPFRTGAGAPFHPLKGPMTTQSLRGMANHGPMHWRGDRTGCTDGGSALDENAAFLEFNPAFVGLLGDDEELPEQHMQEFTDFILSVRYPPNPIRSLDDVPTAAQAAGETFFFNNPVDGGNRCETCHAVDLAQGFFGGDGFSSVEGETQEFKIPHLRNEYQKVGMFGVPAGVVGPGTGFLGDQVRGFGFLHDGAVATVFNFIQAPVFNFANNTQRRQVEQFILALDTGLRPAVGQQVTLTPASVGDAATQARLDLLIQSADAGDCDLYGKGNFNGEARGVIYVGFGSNQFFSDRASEGLVSRTALEALVAAGQEQVYTCAPPGAGTRLGIDRDGDGRFDRDELDAGTDPDDPTSFTGATPVVVVSTQALKMKDRTDPPMPPSRKLTFSSKDEAIVAPQAGSAGDPSVHGARLRVYNSNGSGEETDVALPAAQWLQGSGGWRFKGFSGDPVQSVTLKDGLLKITAGKESWGYSLDEPAQGRIAVRLDLGSGVAWCADAPARLKGTPPTSEKYDTVDKFEAAKNTPAPAACPVPPEGSPSGAFVDGAAFW